jgi:hypothetical protein
LRLCKHHMTLDPFKTFGNCDDRTLHNVHVWYEITVFIKITYILMFCRELNVISCGYT